MMTHLMFNLMLSFFVVHELDAMQRHEWRVLPLTRFLPDPVGRQVFLWAHVPILIAIFWWVLPNPDDLAGLGLSAFAVLHVGLHWMFRRHPAYEFNNPGSWTLIIGTGFFGALHLIAVTLTQSAPALD
ncbi:MAG: hypothetical protein NXI27_21685 [Alphaproteobacteria bacterium]|nr:hypothetical protein [Alphaproteobacteria bacterium]